MKAIYRLSSLFILFLFIGSWQNCSAPLSLSVVEETQNSSSTAVASEGGNGGGYDGKVLTFYVDDGSKSEDMSFPEPIVSYSVTPDLPKGLFLNSTTAVIYGRAHEISEYQTYRLMGLKASGESLTIDFKLGVGHIYQVNSPLSSLGGGDSDLGDPTCQSVDRTCTLRAAIEQANSNNIGSRIVLPAKTYALAGETLKLTNRVELVGQGSSATFIDGELRNRVLEITADAVVRSLTVRRGSVVGANVQGAGIRFEVGPFARAHLLLDQIVIELNQIDTQQNGGAGLFVKGLVDVEIKDSIIRNNRQLTGTGSDIGGGGAYFAWGARALVSNTEISGNTGGYWGGGIYFQSTESHELIRVRVTGNNAMEGGGLFFANLAIGRIADSEVSDNWTLYGDGGGIYFSVLYDMEISNSTFSNNRAGGQYNRGGGIFFSSCHGNARDSKINHSTFYNNTSAREGNNISAVFNSCNFTVENSVFYSSIGRNCDNQLIALNPLGVNLFSDTTCLFASSSDLVGVDPQLGPLASNGGATRSHAPLSSASPVVNKISLTSCLEKDQRGVVRPQGGACDIGSVEAF